MIIVVAVLGEIPANYIYPVELFYKNLIIQNNLIKI